MCRAILAAVIIVGACGCSKAPADFKFPAAVAEWSLSGTAKPVPPPAGSNAEAAWEGNYRAPGQPHLAVRLERMKTQAAAFERVQTTRPQSGALFFHTGASFVTVTGQTDVPNQTLNRFAAALEHLLGR